MAILKYLEIFMARMIDGLYRPFSKDPMVCRETSRSAASSSWLIPLRFLISSSLFFTGEKPVKQYGKRALHRILYIIQVEMSSILSISEKRKKPVSSVSRAEVAQSCHLRGGFEHVDYLQKSIDESCGFTVRTENVRSRQYDPLWPAKHHRGIPVRAILS